MEPSAGRLQALRDLSEIISDQFTHEQLILFLRQDPSTFVLTRELPGHETSPAEIAHALIGLLDRHGLLCSGLMARLSISRPRARDRFLQISAGLGLDPTRICSASTTFAFCGAAFTQTLVVAGSVLLLAIVLSRPAIILLPVTVAPLLLFRSEASTAAGARIFVAYRQKIYSVVGVPNVQVLKLRHELVSGRLILEAIRSLVLLILLVSGSLVIRTLVTLRFAIEGVRSVLANWSYFTFSQRLTLDAELVPNAGPITIGKIGGENLGCLVQFLVGTTALRVVPAIVQGRGIGMISLLLIAVLILRAWNWMAIGVATVCRLSVKGSFVLWFPIVLMIHVGARSELPFDVYIEFARVSELHKLRRMLAGATIIVFLLSCATRPWGYDVLGVGLFSGGSGLLLCVAALVALVTHYRVVEPAREHLMLGIRSLDRIVRLVEVARVLTIMAVMAAIVCWLAPMIWYKLVGGTLGEVGPAVERMGARFK